MNRRDFFKMGGLSIGAISPLGLSLPDVLARELRGRFFSLERSELQLLELACMQHSSGETRADVTGRPTILRPLWRFGARVYG